MTSNQDIGEKQPGFISLLQVWLQLQDSVKKMLHLHVCIDGINN